LNTDGRPDVVTVNHGYNGTVSVLLGNGDGTLSYDFDSSNFATGGGVATDVGLDRRPGRLGQAAPARPPRSRAKKSAKTCST
jgi:hypothetical protein